MFPKKSQILIVDDSPTARIIVRELLSRLGYIEITDAQDGLDAIDVLEKIYSVGKDVQLVITDWNMPRMSGLDLLVYAKQNQKYSEIPFLMFTAESDLSLVSLAISSGADEFIVKPVTEENLVEKLEVIWKRVNSKT